PPAPTSAPAAPSTSRPAPPASATPVATAPAPPPPRTPAAPPLATAPQRSPAPAPAAAKTPAPKAAESAVRGRRDATEPPVPAPAPAKTAANGPGGRADHPPEFIPDDEAIVDERLAGEGDRPGSGEPALAKVLVETGQVTPGEMQAALREASATGRKLGEILSELGLVT